MQQRVVPFSSVPRLLPVPRINRSLDSLKTEIAAQQPFCGLVVGRDIPSRPIAGILRNLMLCEPIAEFSDFRIRHAGTAYIAHYGHDVTGKLMSDLFDPDIFKHNCTCAAAVIRSGQPEVLDANLSQFGISRRHYEVVQLPVWGPDKAAKWMLCGNFCFE